MDIEVTVSVSGLPEDITDDELRELEGILKDASRNALNGQEWRGNKFQAKPSQVTEPKCSPKDPNCSKTTTFQLHKIDV